MAKTPQFIINMKQPPRRAGKTARWRMLNKGVPIHGNRRTSSSSHSDSVNGAGEGSRGSDAADAIAYSFSTPGDPRDFSVDPGVGTLAQLFEDPVDRPIPHCGILAGEIIGYRIWWVDVTGYLRSVVMNHVFWYPDKPMEGNVDKFTRFSIIPRRTGVYAFKHYRLAKEEYFDGLILTGTPRYKPIHTVGVALGSVKLWGEVVEHELGYRAQFAKVASVDFVNYFGQPREYPNSIYFGSLDA